MRRELVLEAALRVFSEKGYRASMGDIAQAVGITRPVLYYYVQSKADLFVEVTEAEIMKLLQAVLPQSAGVGAVPDILRSAVDAWLTYAHDNPESWRMLFHIVREDHPEVAAARKRLEEIAIGAVAVLSKTQREALEFPMEGVRARVAGQLLLWGGAAVIDWSLANPSVPRSEVVDATTGLWWAGLRDPGKLPGGSTEP
jgi:AcrR family transcriptional regulator